MRSTRRGRALRRSRRSPRCAEACPDRDARARMPQRAPRAGSPPASLWQERRQAITAHPRRESHSAARRTAWTARRGERARSPERIPPPRAFPCLPSPRRISVPRADRASGRTPGSRRGRGAGTTPLPTECRNRFSGPSSAPGARAAGRGSAPRRSRSCAGSP